MRTLSTFAARLRVLRADAGLSQRDLAKAINVSAMAVSKWEGGDILPSSSNAIALSEALGCRLDWLLIGYGNDVDALAHCVAIAFQHEEISRERAQELAMTLGKTWDQVIGAKP